MVAHGFPDLQRCPQQPADAVYGRRRSPAFIGKIRTEPTAIGSTRKAAFTRAKAMRAASRAPTRKAKWRCLAERWQGKRLNAPNDIAVRKEGDVYFTDPAFGNQQDTRELDFFGVYHISRKGELEVIAKPKGRPNGIALSPDGRTLYVSNSDERNVRAYDLRQKRRRVERTRADLGNRGRAGRDLRRRKRQSLRRRQSDPGVYAGRQTARQNRHRRDSVQLRVRRSGSGIAIHHRADLGLSRALGRERDLRINPAVRTRTAAVIPRARSSEWVR